MTYTADEGYFFKGGSDTAVVSAKAAQGITITTETECELGEATINDTYYPTLRDAIDAVTGGEKVTLCKDITTAETAAYVINKELYLDFNGYTITKTVPNDWVFVIAKGAKVEFKDDSEDHEGGIKFCPIALGNKTNPASMVQILGKLTVTQGVYESDFTIFEVDEGNSAVGELTVNHGAFNIVDAAGYAGEQWAVMNWGKAKIEGGEWNGEIGTCSCDSNTDSKAGVTTIENEVPKCKLFVGCPGDTTWKNFPKLKCNDIEIENVVLKKASDCPLDLELYVDDDGYITVRGAVAVTGVTLDIAATNVAVGAEFTLTATYAPANADIEEITWESDNDAYASVDENGVVTAESVGEATITVTVTDKLGNAKSAECVVTVKSAVEPVVPEDPQVIEADTLEEAQAKAAQMTVALSDDAKTAAGEQADTVAAMLKVTAVESSLVPGIFVTEVEFKDEATNTVAAVCTTITTELGGTDLTSEAVTVTVTENVIPGLYYGIVAVDDLANLATTQPAEWELADETGVTLSADKPAEATQAFYRVVCAPAPKAQVD